MDEFLRAPIDFFTTKILLIDFWYFYRTERLIRYSCDQDRIDNLENDQAIDFWDWSLIIIIIYFCFNPSR